MTKPDITPEAVERTHEDEHLAFIGALRFGSRVLVERPNALGCAHVETFGANVLHTYLRAQAERIVELEKETRELALDCLTAHGQADDALCDAKTARNNALREAAHECEQVAYSGKYPQDDQSELGCLRCRDNILALIEGDTNDPAV